MNSWVPKTNTKIFTALFLLLSISVYSFMFFVTKSKIDSIELAYSNTASSIAREEDARKIKSVAEENSGDIDFLMKYFVAKGDEVVFIEDVESLAKDSGIKFIITSITPVKAPGENSESKEISVKVNIEGAWSSMMSFLDGLEKLPFGVSVLSFSLDKSGGKGWSGNVEFIVFN